VTYAATPFYCVAGTLEADAVYGRRGSRSEVRSVLEFFDAAVTGLNSVWTVSTFVLYVVACRQGTRAGPVPVQEFLQNFCVEREQRPRKKEINEN
jgi:hypothetical protein